MSQLSKSSDYFDNDPEFVKALANVALPDSISSLPSKSVDKELPLSSNSEYHAEESKMPPSTQPCLKRKHRDSSDEEGQSQEDPRHTVLTSIDQSRSDATYLTSDTYGASHFGDWGEYMHRKRQKLQVQNTELNEGGTDSHLSRIFRGIQIYINGWTEPSVQELRQMIIRHGGVFHAYLDKKSLVTHIITCSLTPAKIREFKNMKIATPEWLIKSIEAGVLLPWYDFRYEPTIRSDATQGKKAPQKSLFNDFLTQPMPRTNVGKAVDDEDTPVVNSITQKLAMKPPVLQPVPGPSSPPRSQNAPCSSASPSASTQRPVVASTSTTTTPTRPLYSTDPASPEQAARVPGYAADKSNIAAQRAMADPAWRAAHTSVAPDFIEGYYRNSRLHHLSTWKAELRYLVAEAQERAENGSHSLSSSGPDTDIGDSAVFKIVRENMDGKNWARAGQSEDVSMKGARLVRGKGRGRVSDGGERVIMHCDFDSFFVSAGLVDRPHLRGKPVVVCHSQGGQGGQSSTSEIASASYEARKFGVKSGMSLQQARALCPTLSTIPYEFQLYKQFSLQFYTILMAHADDLQAVSVDEALIDVTSSVQRIKTEISLSQEQNDATIAAENDPAKDFAEAIRAQVKSATGCEVSIGIARNIMLARLASRRAKPAGSYHLLPENVSTFMKGLDIDALHGFGYAAHQKAQEKLGTTSLQELAKKSKAVLCDALGKGTGETLYKAIRGIDDKGLESDKPRRSVSCDINYGIRFENNDQAEAFIYQLSEEVSRRLREISMCGRSLTLKIMKRDPSAPVEAPKFMGHGLCESFTKQIAIIAPRGKATNDTKVLGDHAWKLLKGLNFDPKELRGIGIQVQKLEKADAQASGSADQQQAVLPFKPASSRKESVVENARQVQVGAVKRAEIVDLTVSLPSSKNPGQDLQNPLARSVVHDLPSYSQVDMSVLEALPADLRAELESEYQRRSVTPAYNGNHQAAADKGKGRARSESIFREGLPPTKILVKGTSNMDVKHITRQLAPKSRTSLSPTKSTLFNNRQPIISSTVSNSVKLKVSEADLRKLDIDPEVFAALPPDLQREQIALAKHAKAPEKGAISYTEERKVLKPSKRTRRLGTPGIVIPPPPPPQACYPDPPSLKQRGKKKGEKLFFTETDDVQDVVEKWFYAFREKPPNNKDVEFFETWLVRCVDGTISTDCGLEKGIQVMKWWMILLRREFGSMEVEKEIIEELLATPGRPDEVDVGRSWWSAFRGVKAKMDAAARRKFGGSLSLR